MDPRYNLEVSVVVERRIEPSLVGLQRTAGRCSDHHIRDVACQLRSLRAAWRAISLASYRSGYRAPLHPGRHRPNGDMVRIDVRVTSHEPLVHGSAYSANDARMKLEALSHIVTSDLIGFQVQVYRSTLDVNAGSFEPSPWVDHWYCTCGGMSLEPMTACLGCATPRAQSDSTAAFCLASAA